MAQYSKKEFAGMCSMPSKNLATYIGRGAVIVNDQGKIDTDIMMNRDFLRKREEKHGKKTPETVIEPRPHKPASVKLNAVDADKEIIYERKKEYEARRVDKIEVETKLKELELQNKMGRLIDTDLVRTIIIQLGKSFITNYKDGANNFLMEIAHRKKMSPDELADLRGVQVKLINRFHDAAVNDAIKQLEMVIKQTEGYE